MISRLSIVSVGNSLPAYIKGDLKVRFVPGGPTVTLRAMSPDRLNRITIEQGKCGGRPCIRGFRIRVTDILQLLSAGASFEEILDDYSFLEREDILAAIEFAAHQTDHSVLQAS